MIVATPPDPMLAAADRWRALNKLACLACTTLVDEPVLEACIDADVAAPADVVRTTASTEPGWRALMGILADTLGQVRRPDLLDCVSRSYAAIYHHTEESEL